MTVIKGINVQQQQPCIIGCTPSDHVTTHLQLASEPL